jgi:hypothetical protein
MAKTAAAITVDLLDASIKEAAALRAENERLQADLKRRDEALDAEAVVAIDHLAVRYMEENGHIWHGVSDMWACRVILNTALAAYGDARAKAANEAAAKVAADRYDIPPDYDTNPVGFHEGWEICAREIHVSIRALNTTEKTDG